MRQRTSDVLAGLVRAHDSLWKLTGAVAETASILHFLPCLS